MLETHFYDGKINKVLPIENNLTVIEKREKGIILYNNVKNIINPIALHFLKIMIHDMGHANNYDATNKIYADDLICLCCQHMHNDDFIKELEIQLLDMKNGFCSQGRTHRLYQLLIAFC